METTEIQNPFRITAIISPEEDTGLTLNEYQRRAMTTCMESCENEAYMMLNLIGEAGELASKMAKAIRGRRAMMDSNRFITENGNEAMTPDEIADMRKECGDILWQLAGFCAVMEWSLESVARENLAKLASRKARGVIDADGDNR